MNSFSSSTHFGSSAAEHLPPSFPERAARGTAQRLRAWQAEALDTYFVNEPRNFLTAATPGAGKTAFALRLASELLVRKTINRIIVVAPTEHVKNQWADAATRVHIRLDPTFRNTHKQYGRHYHGIAVTYAQIAMRPHRHRALIESANTLVILDEIHHGGDTLSWGDAIREACEPAKRRLLLTGTPFRSDTSPIPFVTYLPTKDGTRVSHTDYRYGYGRALHDGVVRPIIFMIYAGHMKWRTRAGENMEAKLGEDNIKDVTAQAWRAALDPSGEWIPAVFRAADRRLTEVRRSLPDAGGLVIATDHYTARAYAKILHHISGEAPTLVLSDHKEASAHITKFSTNTRRWMVAVRMVSEGVDIPRLAVGVYATNASTPLFFAQAVGRFVRTRRRGETATVFLPNVPSLMVLANALEQERDHVLGTASETLGENLIDNLDQALLSETTSGEFYNTDMNEWETLESYATFDAALYNGTEYGHYAKPGSDEELDFIGIPGLLEPEHVDALLKHRQARQVKRNTAARRRAGEGPSSSNLHSPAPREQQPLYRTLAEQRRLLNSLVGFYSASTGNPHAHIHAELRTQCGGPAVAQASVTQLEQRIQFLRKRLGHTSG